MHVAGNRCIWTRRVTTEELDSSGISSLSDTNMPHLTILLVRMDLRLLEITRLDLPHEQNIELLVRAVLHLRHAENDIDEAANAAENKYKGGLTFEIGFTGVK